jgi:hypothetical protein
MSLALRFGASLQSRGYIDKGTLVTIGSAVAEVGRLRLGDFVASVAWLTSFI